MKLLDFATTPNGRTVRFQREALVHLWRHRQRYCFAAEAGGQLFGTIDEITLRIISATGPRKQDKRGPFHYHPNRDEEQREIELAYEQGLHLLGDWHTHRQQKPSPSRRDKKTVCDCVRQSEPILGGLLLAIVGLGSFPDGLHVSWCGPDRCTRLQLLRQASPSAPKPLD